MKPIISVIVPIYNVEKYLDQCLLSIQQQTYPHLQVILIDDGSTDQSASIAQRFVDIDSRFQLLRQANAGQSVARNRGIGRASGKYISFIDADDYIAPDFYETLLCEMKDADVLQFGYTRVDSHGKTLDAYTPCCKHQYTTPWSRLFCVTFIHKNNLQFEEGHIYEDVLFSIDLWLQHPKIKISSYTGYYYRTNPTSTTSTKRDTSPLFQLLSQRFQIANLRGKFLILYTRIRLKLHFFLDNQ